MEEISSIEDINQRVALVEGSALLLPQRRGALQGNRVRDPLGSDDVVDALVHQELEVVCWQGRQSYGLLRRSDRTNV